MHRTLRCLTNIGNCVFRRNFAVGTQQFQNAALISLRQPLGNDFLLILYDKLSERQPGISLEIGFLFQFLEEIVTVDEVCGVVCLAAPIQNIKDIRTTRSNLFLTLGGLCRSAEHNGVDELAGRMVFPLARSPVIFAPDLNTQLRAEREKLLGERLHVWHIVNLVNDLAGFLGNLVAVQMDRTVQVLRPDIRTAVHLQLNTVFIGYQSGVQNFLFLRRGILHGLPKTIGFIKSFHCISFQQP